MSTGWCTRDQVVAQSALVIVLMMTAGCISTASPFEGRSLRARVELSQSSPITESELEGISVSNLYDAVARLRPSWLRSGSDRSTRLRTVTIVAVDGVYFGEVEELRTMSLANVALIEFHDGTLAAANIRGLRASRVHIHAAILVTIRDRS